MSKKTIQALRERRAVLAKETRNALEQNPGATWTAEHQASYDSNIDEIGRLEAEIDRTQKVMDLDSDRQFQNATGNTSLHNEAGEESNVKQAFHAYLRGGLQNMSAQQIGVLRNTMSTTTGSEGGFTVQTSIAKEFSDALKLYGGVRAVADVFTTDQGNDIQYPNSDGTLETGELIAQNAPATSADVVFGTSTLSVYKFSSKVVTVPFELLQDSTLDIEAIVRQRLVDRLGRVTNTYFTTGTGTAQPKGVVTAAGSGKIGIVGQTVTVTYDDLVDLIHSVDPAYRKLGCEFMFNDSTLKAIRKLKDSQGRPIFVPGYEVGVPGGAPDTLLGEKIQINQDIAAMSANAKSILYGYFKAYKVRDVMDVTMFRFTDSAYAKLGQVGFMAWMRAGGTFVDVGQSLKAYVNSAT